MSLNFTEGLSHDPVMAAAMLLVVVERVFMTSPSFQLDCLSSSVCRWLSLVEQKPFSKLCLHHAFLAKFPSEVLIEMKFKGEPFLLAVFSSLCDLFERYLVALNGMYH